MLTMTTQVNTPDKNTQYSKLFLFLAIGLLVVGIIHLSSALGAAPPETAIADTIFHIVMAIGYFACSRLVKAGKRLVIYLLVLFAIAAILYGLLLERGFNYIILAIDVYFIYQMVQLLKRGNLV